MESTNNRSERLYYYLCLIGFFAIFSTTISKGLVLSLWVTKGLGGDPSVLGLINFFSPLAGILFSFPIGVLASRLGHKKLLIVSAFFFVLSPLGYLVVTNPYWLIPIRFIHGVATAILGPIVATIISNVYTKERGSKLGMYSSATLVSRALAPVLAGYILSYFAYLNNIWTYRAVYVAAFILALPVFVLVLLVPDRHEHNLVKKFAWSDFMMAGKAFVRNHLLLSAAWVQMAIYFAYGVLEAFLPVYLSNLSFAASQIGIVAAMPVVALAISQPFFGRLADSVDKRIQIILGVLLVGLSLGVIPFFSDYYIFILLALVFGLGISLSSIAVNAFIADVASEQETAPSFGALSSIMDLGQSVGPLLTGLVITSFSYYLGFGLSFALCLLVSANYYFVNFYRPAPKGSV